MSKIAETIEELQSKRNKIDEVIASLRSLVADGVEEIESSVTGNETTSVGGKKRKPGLTPEGRQRIADAAKKRWALYKKLINPPGGGKGSGKKVA